MAARQKQIAQAALIAIVLVVVAVLALRQVRTHHDPYVPTPEEAESYDVLRGLLVKVDQVLRRNGIPYWPMGGTMLGAVRHQGIIPWDDDIDIGVWEHDLPRAAEAVQAELGGLVRWWRGARCFKATPKDRSDTVIDIFPMSLQDSPKGRIITFASQLAREFWPREYFTEEEFGRGQKVLPFEGLVLRGPDAPCAYLDRTFPGWASRGYNTEGHSPSPIRRLGAKVAPATYVFNVADSRRLCGA